MKNIKAILFDIDGTLLDTGEMILQSYEYTLKKHGLSSISREQIIPIIGPAARTTYSILVPDADHEALFNTHRNYQATLTHLSRPFPHTLTTVKKLHKKGLKLAAVTTRSRFTSTKTLEDARIAHYFDIVISGEDVVNHKPHPEGVLKALKHLNMAAEHAIMIGDTGGDIKAGKAAGTRTIGVTYGMLGKKMKEHNADMIIDDIADLLSIF